MLDILGAVALALLSLGVVIFVHELGHFVAAKWCGAGVFGFSIGFGRAIWRHVFGGTEFRLGWLPLGGYCEIIDHRSAAALEAAVGGAVEKLPAAQQAMVRNHSRWLCEKGFFAQLAVYCAGPAANILLAFVLWVVTYTSFGTLTYTEPLVVKSIVLGSTAEVAGLRAGDTLSQVNGKPVITYRGFLQDALAAACLPGSETVTFTFKRHEQDIAVNVTSFSILRSANERNSLGLSFSATFEPQTLFAAISSAAERTIRVSVGLGRGMLLLFSGQMPLSAMSGPVGIIHVVTNQVLLGLFYFLNMTAVINVAIALFNLLPLPPLDGGQTVFAGLRTVMRTDLSDKIEMVTTTGGAIFLLLLLVIATAQDLVNFAVL